MEQKLSKGFNWFKWMTIGVFCVFSGILVMAVVVAKSRSFTGVTGVDAAQIRQMRLDAEVEYREARAKNQPYARVADKDL